MKKILFCVIALFCVAGNALAYEFSAVAPSGQTLYYNIVNGNAEVTTGDAYFYANFTDSLIIPSSVSYNNTTYTVTSIGSGAFSGCLAVTGPVTIPNTVTSIGSGAFSGCRNLISVTIPNSVTSIGGSAFYGCSGLTSVTIPNSVTSIGERAFMNCSGLTTVNFNATNCTSMGSTSSPCFSGCSALTTLNIGNNVTNIPSDAFYSCSSLTSFTIPNSVTSIGSVAFSGCTSLTSLTIGNSVTSIGYSAFSGCSGLTSVYYTGDVAGWCSIYFDSEKSNPLYYGHNLHINNTLVTDLVIPNSVASIGDYAFFGCSELTEIHSLNPVPPTANSSTFNGVPTNIPVYIPCSRLSYYTSVTGWSQFTNFIEIGAISLSAVSDNNTMGSVQILTSPTCSDPQAVVYAQANSGYQFDHWSDNSTANPYTLNVTEDMVLTAYFSPVTTYYTITVTSNNDAMGTVSGGGSFAENTTATITATAYSGYQFDHWQDGNTSNPRTITVLSDATYTAYFATNTTYYTINVVSSDATMGSVTGGGSYVSSTTVTLIATPNSGYRFDHWQDGSTANPRTITVTGNATYTAYFEVNQPSSYTIFADCNNPIWGSVTGGGTYTMNSVITLNAIANNGYRFVHWQDGNTENPRTITVTGNATYIAYFEANPITSYYTISVLSSDPNMGAADGSGVYAAGSTATISATANEGYHFVQWQDGNIINPRTITVTADAEYIAYFAADVSNEYTITVIAQNPSMGSTTGSGTFAYGTVTTITAEPYEGYYFVQWNDGNTQRIRTITVTGDATYTAYFDHIGGTQGIDDIAAEEVRIYARGSEIVIEGAENSDAVVYDVMGRIVHKGRIEGPIHVNAMGVYMVKIADRQPQKVVVR